MSLARIRTTSNLADSYFSTRSSGRFVKRWGIHYELSKSCAYPDGLRWYRYDGQFITHQRQQKKGEDMGDANPFKDAPLYDTTRYDLHQLLIKRAKELGVQVSPSCPSQSAYNRTLTRSLQILMNSRVAKYVEETDFAGVEVDGKLYKGDVVLGADGESTQYNFLRLPADVPPDQASSRRLASSSSVSTTLLDQAVTPSSAPRTRPTASAPTPSAPTSRPSTKTHGVSGSAPMRTSSSARRRVGRRCTGCSPSLSRSSFHLRTQC